MGWRRGVESRGLGRNSKARASMCASCCAGFAVAQRRDGANSRETPFRRTGPAGGNVESKGLREALPDFLAEAGDRTGGFFQRRLARCFAERAGRRFGESQVFLERADADLKAKVLRWKVVKL